MQRIPLKKAVLQMKFMISKFDSTILFHFSRKSGKTLLIGGWLIFFIWLVGRYYFIYNLKILEFIGFLWVYFGFFVGVDFPSIADTRKDFYAAKFTKFL